MPLIFEILLNAVLKMTVGVHYKIECSKFPLKMVEKSYFEDDDDDDDDDVG